MKTLLVILAITASSCATTAPIQRAPNAFDKAAEGMLSGNEWITYRITPNFANETVAHPYRDQAIAMGCTNKYRANRDTPPVIECVD